MICSLKKNVLASLVRSSAGQALNPSGGNTQWQIVRSNQLNLLYREAHDCSPIVACGFKHKARFAQYLGDAFGNLLRDTRRDIAAELARKKADSARYAVWKNSDS
jgi:hypothetical protein